MDSVIYVNQPLSSQKIMEILDKHPEVQKITCPPSLYKRISPRYLDVLNKLGVEVEPVEKTGRPRKYGAKEKEALEKMFREGYTPQEISDTMDIPLKTVYYLNKTPLKRGRKPKYSPETKGKINSCSQKGVSAREISEKLNIPLRTVYDLLEKRKIENHSS